MVFRPDKAEAYELLGSIKKIIGIRFGYIRRVQTRTKKVHLYVSLYSSFGKQRLVNVSCKGFILRQPLFAPMGPCFVLICFRREMLIIYGDGVETYVSLYGRAEKLGSGCTVRSRVFCCSNKVGLNAKS